MKMPSITFFALLIFWFFLGVLLACGIPRLCRKVNLTFYSHERDTRSLINFFASPIFLKKNRYICICGSAKTSPHNQWSEKSNLEIMCARGAHSFLFFFGLGVVFWKDRKLLWSPPRISITVIIKVFHNMVYVHLDAFIVHGHMGKR